MHLKITLQTVNYLYMPQYVNTEEIVACRVSMELATADFWQPWCQLLHFSVD